MTHDETDLRILRRVCATIVVWNDHRQVRVCLHCQCPNPSKVHEDTCVYRAFKELLDRVEAEHEAQRHRKRELH